jgi:hypothetical protein
MDATQLFAHLRSTAFQELTGSQISARVPIARTLLNRIVADALKGKQTPVRAVDVQPLPDDRFEVTVTLSMPFVPALKVTVSVAQQPRFPESPVMVFRWSLFGGLAAIASRFTDALQEKLPAGVRLDGDRIVLDIPVMAEHAAADGVQLLLLFRRVELHTVADRAMIDVDIAVPLR